MNAIMNISGQKRPYSVVDTFQVVDGMGRDLSLTCYSDGEVLFWGDEGFNLSLSGESLRTLWEAMQALNEAHPLQPHKSVKKASKKPLADADVVLVLEKSHVGTVAKVEQGSVVQVFNENTKVQTVESENTVPKSVRKEDLGWGATVASNKQGDVRYYYQTRDQARKAELFHTIGQAGRIK